jgi:hypothetical protein
MNLLTVVFAPEISYLKIQARSIDLYVSEIEQILVIVNDDNYNDIFIDTKWWGRHRDRVVIKYYKDLEIFPAQGIRSNDTDISIMQNGWDRQQYCKLAGAAMHDSPVLILDAKTWFVQQLDMNLLFDDQGRARFHPSRIPEVFQPGWKSLCDWFKKEKKPIGVGPLGVPFVMFPSIVKDLIDHIVSYNNQDFSTWFAHHVGSPYFITEFTLYSYYILYRHGSYDKFYSEKQHYKIVNISRSEMDQFEHLFREMKDPAVLTVSIHRDSQDKLPREKVESWKTWLRNEKGLNI